jgi:hypothetical protein
LCSYAHFYMKSALVAHYAFDIFNDNLRCEKILILHMMESYKQCFAFVP